MRPLTVDEQKFATKYHNLVYIFLRKRHLSYYEYYDIVIFGYLNAVVKYHERKELQQFCFAAIAWNDMNSAYGNSVKKKCTYKRQSDNNAISLDKPMDGYDDITVGDTLGYDAHS